MNFPLLDCSKPIDLHRPEEIDVPMHIAIVNSFPAAPYTAETEYIRRFLEAARRTGHQAYEVVTSDDIHDCKPDFVLVNHEFTPKLTPYFTVGTMWGPYSYVLKDARKLRAVLSYDAYLVGSKKVENYLDALEAATGVPKPRSDFYFLPTALCNDFEYRELSDRRTLAYIGVHWDGLRHNQFLKRLYDHRLINIYGPVGSWKDYPEAYRGSVPFDGNAVTLTLRKHGVVLCIHKDEHRIADTPSMRMFEAAAAGCVIITDEIPFAKRTLGDSVFHIDLKDPPELNLQKVAGILKWVDANPAHANEMARRSHEILNKEFSIEALLGRTCSFISDCIERGVQRDALTEKHFLPAGDSRATEPLIDVIVRAGGRDVSKLRRALRSIAKQTVGRYRVLLVDFKGRADIAACAAAEATARMQIEYLRAEDTGLRSTALWRGLQAVKAPFFAMLDDDDTVLPSHFGNLLSLAKDDPRHVLYYTGAVLYEEEPGHYMSPVNFSGPLGIDIHERRELKFLDVFSFSRLCEFDNYILTNSWIARSSALDEKTLVDPCLEVAEDLYFYLMLARTGTFKLFPSPTAVWHFRSTSRDNSMLDVSKLVWQNDAGKMTLRVSQERMHNGLTFSDMRQMLGFPAPRAPEPTIPVRPRAIPASTSVLFDSAHLTGARMWGFHAPEADGVWTAANTASVHLKLEKPCEEVQLELDFLAAIPEGKSQHVAIEINGQRVFSGFLHEKKLIAVRRKLFFPVAADNLRVRVKCHHLVVPNEGRGPEFRALGVYLHKIKYDVAVPEQACPREVS